MALGPAQVRFVGTKLPLIFQVQPISTGTHLKQMLQAIYDIPRSRLSLFLSDGELHDDSTLSDHGLYVGGTVDLRLEVDIRGIGPIELSLFSDQYPNWRKTVRCCPETTTVSRLKDVVAKEVLGWYDGDTGGMELVESRMNFGVKMEDDDLISEYLLVVDGSPVHVVFKDRLLSNGRPAFRAG